jgi:talin
MLKKKFFFSDANVDRDDPVGLHLLYVQSRDSIISGEHPTQRTEARDLAALQCQIVYGSYVADKHKDGFIE